MMIAVTALLSHHKGIFFDAGGRLVLHKGNLEPHAFAQWRAFRSFRDAPGKL